LFFWMMPTGTASFSSSGCNVRVSILVLLDDAYRHNAKHRRVS